MNNCPLNSARMSRSCALLVVGFLLMTGCSPTGDSSQANANGAASSDSESTRSTGSSFSAEELRKILQQKDASSLSESLNKAKKLGVSRDGLQLLEQVWAGDQSQYSDLAWSTIADPRVRLNLADILVQAAKNGEIKSEPGGAHEFVRDVVNTGSPKLVNQALITLSVFDRDDDVAAIEQVALRHDPQTSRSALIALSAMCAPAAEAALVRIEQEASGSEKEFAKDTRTRMSDYRQRTRGCASR